MVGKNLTFYRLKNKLSKSTLAKMIGVSAQAIGNYENGTRRPDIDILKKLATALNVGVVDLLKNRGKTLQFAHGEFRKTSTFAAHDQEFVRESVEEYFSRFYNIVDILGDNVLPDAPECHKIKLTQSSEENALILRKHLGLALDGPVDDLINVLENKGILMFECDGISDKFSGINGLVNGRPYIAYNKNMNPERKRSTIAHELVHLMFDIPPTLTAKEEENIANDVSGAFLISEKDLVRELGLKRTKISKDMELVCKEYGISMQLLAFRAKQTKIVSHTAYVAYCKYVNVMGGKKKEPSRINPEVPYLFKQLVFRAINENEININKGAELLKLPYDNVMEECCFDGVC